MFQSIDTTIITSIQKSLGKSSGLIIDSVIDHTINISKYNPLAGCSYIKLPKELNHTRKGLINVQNSDENEWFKWSIVRYLNPVDCNAAKLQTLIKNLLKKVDLKDIKFAVKIRDIQKTKKNNSIDISVFGYENKEKYPIYVSKKCCEEKHVDSLILILFCA